MRPKKGVELPQEILPLLAFPEDLLCVGDTFQQVTEDCAQVLIFLDKLCKLPLDRGDDWHSTPVFLRLLEKVTSILGLVHVMFQAGVVTPFHNLMKSGVVRGQRAEIEGRCHQHVGFVVVVILGNCVRNSERW